MAFDNEKREARRLLGAIDDGTHNASDTFYMVKDADPTLIYFVFAWLRASYPASHPAADAILGRLGELCTKHPEAARMATKGGEDSIVEWFEDAYTYREFTADEFIELIVEKLEG